MVLALSGSGVGRKYLAQQLSLLQDLLTLLHTASPRVQRQVRTTPVGRSGMEVRAPDSTEKTRDQVYLLPFRNLGNFVNPTLTVSFRKDTKSHWSLPIWCLCKWE